MTRAHIVQPQQGVGQPVAQQSGGVRDVWGLGFGGWVFVFECRCLGLAHLLPNRVLVESSIVTREPAGVAVGRMKENSGCN